VTVHREFNNHHTSIATHRKVDRSSSNAPSATEKTQNRIRKTARASSSSSLDRSLYGFGRDIPRRRVVTQRVPPLPRSTPDPRPRGKERLDKKIDGTSRRATDARARSNESRCARTRARDASRRRRRARPTVVDVDARERREG
jgi:hypothetical protein